MADSENNATTTDENSEETAAAEKNETSGTDTVETPAGEVTFVESPEYDVDYKGDCAYEVKVTIPPANKAKQAEDMFNELQEQAEVPGFRPGRAPRKLIERKFSKAVRGEVETKLITAAFQKLVEDQDLRPIQMPNIDGLGEEDRKDDEPLTFTLKFEVAPKVELGEYKGVEVERPVVHIEDEDVQEAIDNTRSRYATFESVEGEEAQEGDQVVIDFRGTVNGEEFPGGTAQGYPYILGTRRFFKEFEEALLGAKAGQELSCTVKLPDSMPNEDLRGKEADFTIKVNDVKRRQLPELNAEFAKQAGFENVDDMREKVADQLREGSTRQSDEFAEQRALDKVIDNSSYEIPKTMVDEIAENNYQDQVRQFLSSRVPVAQIQEHEEELRNQAREDTINEIKRVVTLNEIIRAEGLEISESDLEQGIESVAERAGTTTDVVSGYLQQDEERRNSYEHRLLRAKAMKVIMDNAKLTDKELPREEASEEDESDNDDTA